MYMYMYIYLPGLGLLMTLKGGEFGMGLLPLLEEVDSTPLVLLCPVLVGLFPCWRALCKGKKQGVLGCVTFLEREEGMYSD